MTVWEILFIAIALSMDAFAVGMTNGMSDPRMQTGKILLVAFAFGLFQFLMPVLGFYLGAAFAEIVEKIAPWLSCALLVLLGGKAIQGAVSEKIRARRENLLRPFLGGAESVFGLGKLAAQAVATSLDALAVGVTLLAAQTSSALPLPFLVCAGLIGLVTFALSVAAVEIGKRAGDRFSAQAEVAGGVVLIGIGLKILVESFL